MLRESCDDLHTASCHDIFDNQSRTITIVKVKEVVKFLWRFSINNNSNIYHTFLCNNYLNPLKFLNLNGII